MREEMESKKLNPKRSVDNTSKWIWPFNISQQSLSVHNRIIDTDIPTNFVGQFSVQTSERLLMRTLQTKFKIKWKQWHIYCEKKMCSCSNNSFDLLLWYDKCCWDVESLWMDVMIMMHVVTGETEESLLLRQTNTKIICNFPFQ